MITLYSTNCTKCQVLEKKLQAKNVEFETVTDVKTMLKKHIMSAPYLEVDGELMDFTKAVEWVNNKEDI